MSEVKLQWVDGMEFAATTGAGHTITMDATAAHGGRDKGPRPLEMLLVGLAGCTAMDVRSILQKKKAQVSGLEVNVKAERATTHPKVYTDIELEYIVRGKGIKESAVKQAVELSQEKYCSASAMLGKTATIHYTYRIVEEG